MTRRVRVLLFSTLYPSSERPAHGIFVETRLRELLQRHPIEAKVVAPVPWFPSRNPRWGNYARIAATPRHERRHDIDVLHPRYLLPPHVGMTAAPILLALGALRAVRQLRREGFDFDIFDAHYFYPDVVAGALLSRWCGRPLVATARGTDVNLIAGYAIPQAMMRWAARQAAACFGVSRALCDKLIALGAARETVDLLPNGVDSDRFRPESSIAARERLGLAAAGPLLVTVGNLVPLKRHQLVLEAFAALRRSFPRAQLAIVGEGPLHAQLTACATTLGVRDALHMPGAVEQTQLRWWFSAADLSVLASSREGWPNVLLESMACGTPVLASSVGGVPEIVVSCVLGRVFETDSAMELASAMADALTVPWDRIAIRAHAESRSWDATSRRQAEIFARIAGDRSKRGSI